MGQKSWMWACRLDWKSQHQSVCHWWYVREAGLTISMAAVIWGIGEGPILTDIRSSQWGETGPELGSAKEEFSGSRPHMIWLVRILDKGPVFDFFHSSNAGERSFSSESTLVIEICQPLEELDALAKTHFTPVPFWVAAKSTSMKGWSVKFFPRLGRLTRGLIPRDFISLESPIPEWKSICGEPMQPAESMTSLVAWMVNVFLSVNSK